MEDLIWHSTDAQVVLQFSTSTAFASTMIRRLCHSPFSHVDFVLEDGTMLGASDQGPRGKVIKGNSCGVAIRPPDYQEFRIRRRAIFATPLAPTIIAIAMSHLGKPFDDTALYEFLADGLTRDWRADDKLFCSELIGISFEAGGFWDPFKLLVPKTRLTPSDFLLVVQVDKRWLNRETFYDQKVPGMKLGAKEQ